jgi:3-methyladenine DNA glycosylase AlkC
MVHTMPEPFKNLLNASTVSTASQHLKRAWPGFDSTRFEQRALDGLDALELKARAMHMADALEATLPQDFEHAATLIEASLAPVLSGPEDSAAAQSAHGLGGWVLWPVGEFIVRRGMAQPQRALAALHAITQRFTAEWAVRPFIAAHPQLCWSTLARWAGDPSEHVRRLVSEGSRPRLPWGMQLRGLIADPSPTLPLLLALQDDPSDYVRRSVANHLNDIAKDHPARVVQWIAQHLPGATAQRRALLKRASRTLIKQGDPAMLKAWGLGRRLRGQASLRLTPKRVALGGSVGLAVTLCSTSHRAQKLVVDYAIHHVKANGTTSPKVFKGWNIDLAGHAQCDLRKMHSMRAVTTRTYHAGRHEVDLRVNGETVASAFFELRV